MAPKPPERLFPKDRARRANTASRPRVIPSILPILQSSLLAVAVVVAAVGGCILGRQLRWYFPGYDRSDVIGSIRIARRAGTRLATMTTTVSNATTPPNTMGSRGVTP